jgi:phosphoglucomutase/phosphomannomutase
LILVTDPDADRMGAAAPVTRDTRGPWRTLNGNQLSALLCEYVLRRRRERGELTADSYVVTTLVTTLMLERICQDFGVRCYSNNLVGFKWICQKMDEIGPDNFVYGTEESHGFLVGQHCRDKDGVVACMLMAELAAEVLAQGLSMFDHLESLYKKFGYHGERLITIQMEGSDGMRRMKDLMNAFRSHPPRSLGGLDVLAIRDYLMGTRTVDGVSEPLDGPQDNLIFMETSAPGNYIAARPSGTEPKVKFYMFTYAAPDSFDDVTAISKTMEERLAGFAVDLKRFADTIE